MPQAEKQGVNGGTPWPPTPRPDPHPLRGPGENVKTSDTTEPGPDTDEPRAA